MVLIFSSEILCGFSDKISKSIPDKNVILADETDELCELFGKIHTLYCDRSEYGKMRLIGCINIAMSIMLPHFVLKNANFEKNSAFYGIMDFCAQFHRANNPRFGCGKTALKQILCFPPH